MGRPAHPAAARRRAPVYVAALAGVVAALAAPLVASAHPLGNLTTNVYSGLRLTAQGVRLDVVVDRAEIPTFDERIRIDADEDGQLTPAEVDAVREPDCRQLAADVAIDLDGVPLELRLAGTGLSFPAGAAAGTPTMRLVCEFVADYPGEGLPAAGGLVTFANRYREATLGWREVVVEADGVSATAQDGGPLRTTSLSHRLTAYPEDLLQLPLDEVAVTVAVRPGGPVLPAITVPEVAWLPGLAPADATPPGSGPPASAAPVAVPGGVGSEIPAIFSFTELTPSVAFLAIVSAIGLGAWHALTPGHGKTLMAAYLVGTRGTAIHAAGLGLSVTLSHTIGILLLAMLVVGAQSTLPPELVARGLPAVAALAIVAIGGWMLLTEVRRRRVWDAGGHGDRHGHEPAHEHPHEHPHPHGPPPDDDDHHQPDAHSHGGIHHSHAPSAGSTITWKSLFTLGLAGGLIPSISALIILLGTIATGHAGFGVVLVVCFGLGMGIVLGGIGVLLVRARQWLDRVPRGSGLGRFAAATPLLAAVVVLTIGLWLTGQAVLGRPAL
jgi:ABC-type nickel/cobalt efflux system permease component RcnA